MFGNLGKLGDIASLMKNAKEMSGRVKEQQEAIRRKTVEASSGGGMVTARMNGAGELTGLEMDPEVVDPEDREMLADLILAAVNGARKKVRDLRLEGYQDLAGGMDLSSLGIDLEDMVD